jgi:hypothetical protein
MFSAPQRQMLARAMGGAYGAVPLLRHGEKRTALALERLGLVRCTWAERSMTADYAYFTDEGRIVAARLGR